MRVLVAVNDSEHSRQMLREVRATAWPPGTAVLIVTVIEQGLLPPPAPGWTGVSIRYEQYAQMLIDQAEALVAHAAETIRRSELTMETAVRTGNVRPVIVSEAQRWAADLIVMGSGDATGLRRLHRNSVAKYVVAHAPCSVEVIRTKPPRHGETAAA